MKKQPKIYYNHTLKEYMSKYGLLYDHGKLLKINRNKDPKKLMTHKTYWFINNQYYELPNCPLTGFMFGNKIKAFITTVVILAILICVVVLPVVLR